MERNPKIDAYIEKKTDGWSRPIVERLREVYLGLGLKEELKWGAPTYSHHGLLCNIGAFKEHVGSWFFQGALLSDPEGVLIQAQKTTKAMRSVRYTSISEVDGKVLLQLVKEAMDINEKGIKVDLSKGRELDIPDYFMTELKKHRRALEHFEQSSYSHKKEYVEWIVEAKREETRERRLKRAIEMLNEGKGKNDRYR